MNPDGGWLGVRLLTAIVNHPVEDELFMFPSRASPCSVKTSVQNCTTWFNMKRRCVGSESPSEFVKPISSRNIDSCPRPL